MRSGRATCTHARCPACQARPELPSCRRDELPSQVRSVVRSPTSPHQGSANESSEADIATLRQRAYSPRCVERRHVLRHRSMAGRGRPRNRERAIRCGYRLRPRVLEHEVEERHPEIRHARNRRGDGMTIDEARPGKGLFGFRRLRIERRRSDLERRSEAFDRRRGSEWRRRGRPVKRARSAPPALQQIRIIEANHRARRGRAASGSTPMISR